MTGHVRQRSQGSFELRYRAAGKTVSTTFRGTKRQAEQELRRLLTDIDKGGRGPSKESVSAWFDRWLGIVAAEISPLTLRLYTSQVENHLRPAFGNDRLDRLSPARIQEEWSKLIGLASSSRRVLHHVLNSSLSRAVELELIPRNPCTVLRRRLPRIERTEQAVLSPAQCVAMLDAVRGTPMLAPVVLGLGLGARRGEIAALRWSRISDDGVATITEALRELSASDIRRGSTKTGKSRRVKLPAYAIAELRAWKREQAEELLRLGVRQGPDTPVCTDPAGRPLSPMRISDGFRALKKRLGLPISFHGLRHTSASIALAAGATVKQVQERLGHSRPSMTLDIYSHVIEGIDDDAAEHLDRAMRNARRE
jgi:integrase